MKWNIDERCVVIGSYIAQTGATVRNAAMKFGVSKSTVHKDITEKLYATDRCLYHDVDKILKKNKSERHLRGGIATREKYKHIQVN